MDVEFLNDDNEENNDDNEENNEENKENNEEIKISDNVKTMKKVTKDLKEKKILLRTLVFLY